jgi:hypothetical protein
MWATNVNLATALHSSADSAASRDGKAARCYTHRAGAAKPAFICLHHSFSCATSTRLAVKTTMMGASSNLWAGSSTQRAPVCQLSESAAITNPAERIRAAPTNPKLVIDFSPSALLARSADHTGMPVKMTCTQKTECHLHVFLTKNQHGRSTSLLVQDGAIEIHQPLHQH